MKFKVTDSKGQTFIAQKSSKLSKKDSKENLVLDEDKKEDIDVEENEDKKEEKIELSQEELKQLKELLPDLLKLVKSKSEEAEENADEDEDSDIDEEADEDKEDEDNFLELDENEEVIELGKGDNEADEEEDILTDDSLDEASCKDSKSSFGAVEKAKTNDSKQMSIEEEINLAWAKRYGGK